MRAAGGIFWAPRPVSTTPLTTGQPQLNLAEDGIRRDATYSPRTEMERSVPSCEENSARRHVGRIPLACPSGRAGTAVAPRTMRAACSSTAGLHGQHEWRGRSSRCWSKRALSPRVSPARYLAVCTPHAPQLLLPAPPTGRRCRAIRRSPRFLLGQPDPAPAHICLSGCSISAALPAARSRPGPPILLLPVWGRHVCV